MISCTIKKTPVFSYSLNLSPFRWRQRLDGKPLGNVYKKNEYSEGVVRYRTFHFYVVTRTVRVYISYYWLYYHNPQCDGYRSDYKNAAPALQRM